MALLPTNLTAGTLRTAPSLSALLNQIATILNPSPLVLPSAIRAPVGIASAGTTMSFTGNLNRAYMLRVAFTNDFTISGVAFGVSTAATAGTDTDAVEVAIYNSSRSRVGTSGVLSGTGLSASGGMNFTGRKLAPLVFTFLANTVYYATFAYHTAGATPATLVGSAFGSSQYVIMGGTNDGQYDAAHVSSVSNPLPASLGAASPGAVSVYPALFLIP